MKNSKREKTLGVITDSKFRFKIHLKNLLKKASQNIWAISRLINYYIDSENKMIFNAITKSQFSQFSKTSHKIFETNSSFRVK